MLVVEGAQKTFFKDTPNERVALNDLCLTVADGEFMTLIGSNGAGKSTLFNAITGGFLLDRGVITLGGEDITWLTPHKRALVIGYIFQNPSKGTAPDMTIEENLALASSRRRKWPLRRGVSKEDYSFFREHLSRFEMGLEDRMKDKVGLLSGGQRQALALLMSTISKPRLLLLDEHTAALDPAAAQKIMKITGDIVREQKLAAMMITHNVQQALDFGSRTVMLEEGRIILDISGGERENMTAARLMEHYSYLHVM
ncbi:MAG: ATP-binding cassette domain-containing protein [Synergistaceae bacterium]|jgi:putative ABC transport system ATP-binding protein|nr:ATP-binding cassette domain-containing protein [Synergistaceae bacterium]